MRVYGEIINFQTAARKYIDVYPRILLLRHGCLGETPAYIFPRRFISIRSLNGCKQVGNV